MGTPRIQSANARGRGGRGGDAPAPARELHALDSGGPPGVRLAALPTAGERSGSERARKLRWGMGGNVAGRRSGDWL